jgi:general secretion pathway protein D
VTRNDSLDIGIEGSFGKDIGNNGITTGYLTNFTTIPVFTSTGTTIQDRTQWVPISTGPGGSVSAPLINSRSADTVVVTPDGQTVIIGGLMQNAKAESVTKIPYLGDIPLLGNLFKHKITTDGRTELIIFLTPYIIRTPTEMASVSDREGEKSDAIKALSERELNKFLDTLPATNQPPKSVSPKKHK